jgi:carboxypeptidase Taq
MKERYDKLIEMLGEFTDLSYALSVLGWDQQTYMPEGGSDERSAQLSTLARIQHEMLVSDSTARLIEDAEVYVKTFDPDSDEARLVKSARRTYDKQVKVPSEKVAEFARVTADAFGLWHHARQTNDFASFRPILERVFDLRREYCGFFAPYEHVYDPLLDDYEPGMKTAEVKQIFTALRPRQVELLKAIAARPQVDGSFMRLEYPERGQWDFGVEVITRLGYDWKRGRQDKTPHPFTTTFGIGDVRITTRFDPKYLGTGLFGTIHECGHAMYEQGVDWKYSRTPLANGASYGMHESQSRMWENLVGRSLPFWKFFYKRLQETFPSQLGNVDLLTFYKGINRVNPSLIRVEADEATYNLHIMLRLELEIEILEGKLAVKDLPDAWNTRFHEYLGINPPNDADGVLQDIHWCNGYIGYFATYSLGNLIASQLWEKILVEIPDLYAQIERGEFSALLAWLRKNVHQYGVKFEPQELIQRITGSKIDPDPYMRYLTRKYAEIYGL